MNSRGQQKRDQIDQIKRVLSEILATGTSVPGVVDMFASALRELNLVEEAELVASVATDLYVRRQPGVKLRAALSRRKQ